MTTPPPPGRPARPSSPAPTRITTRGLRALSAALAVALAAGVGALALHARAGAQTDKAGAGAARPAADATVGGTPQSVTPLDAHPLPAAPTPAATAATPDPCQQTGSDGRCMNPVAPVLRLVIKAAPLPGGTVGKAYDQALRAGGGSPPYRFALDGGALPAGLALGADGRLAGTPEAAGGFSFVARVTDGGGSDARQTYSLRIASGKPAAPRPAPPAEPTVDVAALDIPLPERHRALVWRLDPKDVDDILAGKPYLAWKASGATSPPPDEPVLPTRIAESIPKGTAEVLKRMAGVEFPSRAQFESALEDFTCDAVRELFVRRAILTVPQARSQIRACFDPTQPPVPIVPPPTRLTPRTAAAELLPDYIRSVAVAYARKSDYSFSAAPAGPADDPPTDHAPWTATPDCACVAEDIQGLTYGMYPFWRQKDPAAPPAVDFGSYRRLGYLGATFDSGGGLVGAGSHWNARSGIDLLPHRYDSRLDYVVHRGQWDDLASLLAFDKGGSVAEFTPLRRESDASLATRARGWLSQRIADASGRDDAHRCQPAEAGWPVGDLKSLPGLPRGHVPLAIDRLTQNLVAQIDLPSTDRARGLATLLPDLGLDGHDRMGDGVTLFFDPPRVSADDPGSADTVRRYNDFMQLLLRQLVGRLQASPREVALNLVIPYDLFVREQTPDSTDIYSMGMLYQLLLMAEQPLVEDLGGGERRICESGSDYRSRTPVTVNFIVLMNEPTRLTTKLLKAAVDRTQAVRGVNRRILVRKLVPMLTLGTYAAPAGMVFAAPADDAADAAADGQAADAKTAPAVPAERGTDDLVQFNDDLAYLADAFAGVAVWELPTAEFNSALQLPAQLRKAFVPAGNAGPGGLCRFVCPNRHELRLAAKVLGLLALLGAVAWWASCTVQRLGRPYVIGLLVCVGLFVVLGMALLGCDPALAAVRENNVLLGVLVAGVLLWALYVNLKAQDD
ncbi:Ig domain-containing protein [Derxia gummosa]|uniref:Ig domain-containing protein n=1 Tax=Derxia gummosa DSM 723 TaxID=1121388 RepID=A0A8B6XC11_9BURK|nr:Ig domain-containing protein [Derxia gummosa]